MTAWSVALAGGSSSAVCTACPSGTYYGSIGECRPWLVPCLPTAHSMCFTGWLNCSSVLCAQTKLNVRFKLRTGARVDVILVSLHLGELSLPRSFRTNVVLLFQNKVHSPFFFCRNTSP